MSPIAGLIVILPAAFAVNWLIYTLLLTPLVRRAKSRDALIEYSRGNDPTERRTALIAMRDYGDARTQQRIIEMAKDADVSVRSYAIDYLPDMPAA